MDFFVVHEFYEMRGAWWWLFKASMLHEKTNLSRKDKSNRIWFWILGPFWVFLVNGFVCGCFKDISEVFLDWSGFKIRLFEKKKFILIFQPSQWWLKFKLVDNTSSDLWRNAGHIASIINLYVAPAVLYEICMYVLGGELINAILGS
jgi:hypothetical protein